MIIYYHAGHFPFEWKFGHMIWKFLGGKFPEEPLNWKFNKFQYTLQCCPLYCKFRKTLLHLSQEISRNSNRNFLSNGKHLLYIYFWPNKKVGFLHLIDTWLTVCLELTNLRLMHMSWSTFSWLSTNCWSSVDQVSIKMVIKCWPSIDQDTNGVLTEMLIKCWSSVDRWYELTLDCRCL